MLFLPASAVVLWSRASSGHEVGSGWAVVAAGVAAAVGAAMCGDTVAVPSSCTGRSSGRQLTLVRRTMDTKASPLSSAAAVCAALAVLRRPDPSQCLSLG